MTGQEYNPSTPTDQPTSLNPEELHSLDAYAAVFLNVTLICCVLFAYYIKENRIYYLTESSVAMISGMIIGAFISWFQDDTVFYQGSPEFFFFVLLPPIIFEAGYSLEKNDFFQNIGTITLFAMVGTVISTFTVGILIFKLSQSGWITGVSKTNKMESLLFGALISAVDPVATISIMNNPELQCNKLLYSLVFGESVLNDAVAIVLFHTFRGYYDPDAPDFDTGSIPIILIEFLNISLLSIVVGILLGFLTSFIYKQTLIRSYTNLESTLVFLFCYFCYAVAESLELSGVMALFFYGIVLSHYNAYNLSDDSRRATEQIFATLATVSEIIVFLYMGMGVFTTGKFKLSENISFSLFAIVFCVLGRFLNIMPLSCAANACRKGNDKISLKMQLVLWFAGLRGAIAYALAVNMPGENKETYVTGTLTICIITTIVCGGFAEKVLVAMGMKESDANNNDDDVVREDDSSRIHEDERYSPSGNEAGYIRNSVKGFILRFDQMYLREWFGREISMRRSPSKTPLDRSFGDYELGNLDDMIDD